MFPESAGWTLTNQLLAAAVDIAHWFKWVRCGAEGDPPDRITRPGVVNEPKRRKKGTPMKMSEAKAVYAAVGPVGSDGVSPMTDDERFAKLRAIFGGGG